MADKVALFTLLLSILFAAPAALAQDGDTVDRVIAVVDDEIILESDVMLFVQDIVLRNRDQYRDQEAVEQLKKQVLEELINQKILLSLAEDDTTIVVEDREVDQTLDERINSVTRQLGGEEKLVEYYGKPMRQIRRDFRKQVRDGLFVDKIRSKRLQGISVSRAEVEDFYRRHADKFPDLPERVHLAHILKKIEPTEEAKDLAKARADSLYNLLLAGANFEQLAIANSDDRASGAKGGLLGTTERGDLVPDYEAVAFALDEGEISSPVLTRFGYHIIRLNWRRGEKINTSHILINLKPTKDDEQRALKEITALRERILGGEDFAEIAREYSDDKETAKEGGDLGWFDLAAIPSEFRLAARDLKTGEVSEPFKTQFGIHILKMLEREPSRPVDLNRDWEFISNQALAEKQDRVFREWLDKQRSKVYIRVLTGEE